MEEFKSAYPGQAAPAPVDEKREKVKIVSNLIRDLTFEQNVQFAVSCVNRIKCFTKLLLSVKEYAHYNYSFIASIILQSSGSNNT
jgi:hypothetical protein